MDYFRQTNSLIATMKRHPVKSVVLSGMVMSLAYRSHLRTQDKKKKKILVLPFYKMNLVEQAKPTFQSAIQSSSTLEMPVDELVSLIHDAAKDENIAGLYGIFGNGFGFSSGGWAHLEEVRNALSVFEQSDRQHLEPLQISKGVSASSSSGNKKKPMIAYSNTFANPLPGSASMKEYYLASAFSHIQMQSQGDLNLFGLSATDTFLKDCLKKYGIQVDVFKHGLYKNFANRFTHSKYSKEHKENVEKLMFRINHYICESIFFSRNLGKNHGDYFKFWFTVNNSGSLPAEYALKVGFIDHITSMDFLDSLIDDIADSKDEKSEDDEKQIALQKWGKSLDLTDFSAQATINLGDYAKEKKYQKLLAKAQFNWNENETEHEKIAVLKINGTITDKTAQKVQKALKKLKRDDNVKALVLRVDSPGGAITACEAILQLLQDTEKKTVVSFGNVSASGGYYISAHADRIFASPTSITGSIGVLMIRMNLRKLAESFGITSDSVQVGDLSGSFDPFTPINRNMAANFSNYTDRAYLNFKTLVSQGRGMDLEEVEKVAQGKVFTGDQAKELGLIDELGGLHRAIEYAQKTYTKNGNAEVVVWPPPKSFWEMITGDRDGGEDFLPSLFAIVSQTVIEKMGMNSDNKHFSDIRGVPKFPSAVSGMMLTIDENWGIRCLLQESDEFPGIFSSFPPSFWD